MDRIGVPAKEWSIGYNSKPTEIDGLKVYANWGGASYSPRAAAAVGRLLMRKGDWDGQQLISRQAVERTLAYAGMPLPKQSPANPFPASGLGWYTNFNRVWPNVPPDAFAGAGAGHQTLLVVPSLDLIIVRFGSSLTAKGDKMSYWAARQKFLIEPLMDAFEDHPKAPQSNSQAPHPPLYSQSPIISSVTWAPPQTIRRAALGGDCWPLTWADDDSMYTAYGDGNGFKPQLPRKLSLGLARVDGPSESFHGINIRSPIEQLGNGPAGKKASGIVMVNGILYLLVRNAHNAQLASSADHGQTEGQQHPLRIYLLIWLLLFVFSTFSYLVDYFQLHGLLRWSLIILFMLVKAGLIVAIFMHMRWERLALKFAILIPPLALLILIGLMAIEGAHTFITRWGAFVR